jgi:hypothetical protein
MEKSLKFKFIGRNLVNVILTAVSNQRLLRLIKYLTNTPLELEATNDAGETIQQPDIETDLIDTNIFIKPFHASVLENQEVKLFFHPLKGSLKSQPLGTDTYVLDIVVPWTKWILVGQGELRAYSIAYEFSSIIDGRNDITGVGNIEVISYQESKIDDTYGALSVFMEINNPTGKSIK